MSKLLVASGRAAVPAFERADYAVDHQTGGHIILRHHDALRRRLTVRDHRELARGTLRSLIRQAGLSVEQFRSLL
ncbi:MAG: type II toxin-antitoxin system HicA family toxin [Phycisphaerae bacterium]